MPPEQRDDAYLWDMLQAARDVMEFAAGLQYEDYLRSRLIQAAIERKIEIIGEAARNVSESFQNAHPEIPWRPIVAQRHVLAHEYGDIKQDRIWRVVTVHVPELVRLVTALLPPPPPEQSDPPPQN